MSVKPSIVWFRQDLRLEDQPALLAAIHKEGPVIPLFIWAREEEKEWKLGGASRWWLHHSLESLQRELKEIGLSLVFRRAPSLQALVEVIKQTGADTVFWNRCYEPLLAQRDAGIKAELHRQGIPAQIFNSTLLVEPWTVMNKQHKPYQVFTPFWKACCQLGEPPQPLPKPTKAMAYHGSLQAGNLNDFHLLPYIPWDKGLKEKWQPGSDAALKMLKFALEKVIPHYSQTRNEPGIRGTTELSPYLHYGEISPRMIWKAVRQKLGQEEEAEAFLRQIGWREFAYYLLYHFPRTPTEALHTDFNAFPWRTNDQALTAWHQGQTGYPIVDAGMRQLWQIGWMHNRVRMIVGSFLVKDLLIQWQEGARWFWDTLVDADLANNTLGWQWIAGCGADAAPYFRIFNPVKQGETFDQAGDYVRRWVPELAQLPNSWIHRPWEAPKEVLRQAGIELGVTYPKPIVDHDRARKEALEAYAKI